MRNAKAAAVLLVFQLIIVTVFTVTQISPSLLLGMDAATLQLAKMALGVAFMIITMMLFLFLVTEGSWGTAELYLFFTVLAYLLYAVATMVVSSPLAGLLFVFLLFVMTLIALLLTQDTGIYPRARRQRSARKPRPHTRQTTTVEMY